MTPEEQRIAIAEALGFKWLLFTRPDSTTFIQFVPPKSVDGCLRITATNGGSGEVISRPDTSEIGEEWRTAPDYLNDLNAMHEAIFSLTERRTRQIFEMTLLEVCRPEIYRDPDEDAFAHIEHLRTHPDAYIGWFEVEHGNAFPIINATAAQRAEAFLRTIGKWKD